MSEHSNVTPDSLTMGQCVAGIAYLASMLMALWLATGSVVLVVTVFAISLVAGVAHVKLSGIESVRHAKAL